MITNIRYLKPNKDTIFLHSKSELQKECVQKNENKTEIMNQSASVNTGGFFSPKNTDTVTFGSSAPKKGFWSKLGENPRVQKFIKGKTFESILKKADNFADFESLFMCLLAVSVKPIMIMALPAKEDDKKYAATKALLGGVVDFGIATAVVTPIAAVIDKFNEKIKKDPKILTENISYLKNEKNFESFKKVVSYAPKLAMVPARSVITIALIPPTLKLLFPEEAKRKEEKKKAAMTQSVGGAK